LLENFLILEYFYFGNLSLEINTKSGRRVLMVSGIQAKGQSVVTAENTLPQDGHLFASLETGTLQDMHQLANLSITKVAGSSVM
jgi:hypothetical protein